ncbi:MAG: MMPL family transporter [Rhodospirillaceae bacterium]|nr:MMPL family transporter [Rhodospirillaceae bacterium]
MLSTVARNIVSFCRRSPWTVVGATAGVLALSIVAAATLLSINTDIEALFDNDVPFRAAEKAFDAQFPGEVDVIVAVVDAPSAMLAEQAGQKLAAKLKPRADLFATVTTPGGGPFFQKNGLLYLSTDELNDLSAKLAEAQPLLASIATDRNARGLFRLFELGFTGAAEGAPGAEGLAPAVQQTADVIDAALAGQTKSINWAALFGALAPPGQTARAMVVTQPKLDFTSLEHGGEASDFIRASAKELGLTPEHGYRVRLTGQIPLADEEFATVAEGTGVAGAVSVVLVALLLLLALGSLRVVGATLITLLAGLVMTIGWAAISVHELNLISVAFAVMFVGIAVDFAIQFCMRYRAERRAREPASDALDAGLDAAGGAMAKSLLLAAAATALGFFSFLPTDYRGVAQLGVIAGGGMIVAVVLSFTLLPALLRLMRPAPEKGSIGYAWAAPFNRALLTRRRAVIGGSALLAVLALAVLPRLTFDFDPLKLKDPTTESMATALELMDDPLVNPNTLSVLVADPEAAKAMAAKLSALPEVSHVITISDLVPSDQEEKLAALGDLSGLLGPAIDGTAAAKPAPSAEDLAAAARAASGSAKAYLAKPNAAGPLRDAAQRIAPLLDRLAAAPDRIQAVSANLLGGFDDAITPLKTALDATPVTIADIPEDLRATFIAKDGRYRVQAFPAATGSNASNLAQFLKAVRRVAPDAQGAPVAIYESGVVVTSAFATAAILALVTITLLLFAIVRRLDDVLRVLAPLLFAGLLTLGTCAITGFALNFANIIALPLLLGVGVTFPIYFVTAWRDGEGLLLSSPAGRGMLFSALTTAAAFGSLALSKHPGTSAMGELLAMSLAYTLLATLVLLPALLGPAPEKA